ncbi:LemA protein [Candidatus Sumerlaea chitinivorans]|jgi:LemA protein|uniref:LemA protein n=1 Tax=Sumerlaea chitinivorans TaxID=2250252 RepID=A0A2Z4Y6I3_SUMC1|nr:LemA protein [Candidatus Sumerlaea chitinivorans]
MLTIRRAWDLIVATSTYWWLEAAAHAQQWPAPYARSHQEVGGGRIVGYIVIGILLFILIWIIATYNAFVRLKNYCREAWAGIDTELRRRYDLIPNLVEVVKGYAKHEREVLEAVIQARARAVANQGRPTSQAADENQLVQALERLLLLVENYPQLRANEQFLALQRELVNTEDRIQAARRFYNANVRELNTRIQVFPSNIIASLFGFTPEEFFDVAELHVRQAPEVKMS